MANIKKLNQEQEYKVAFLHYLGHSDEDLAKEFQVSPALIYKTYKKYQNKIINDLKEVVTPSKNPFERNLEYVVSKIKKDRSFINTINIFENDEFSLVTKLFEESLEKIKFKEYMEPRSGYDHLIKSIFGERYCSKVGTIDIFSDYLSNLNLDEKLDENKLVNRFSENIKERVRKGYFSIEISNPKKKIIDDILNTLTKREEEILKLYFGVDCKSLNLKEVGDKFNISRERVRQIKEKGIRGLRHYCRANILRKLYGYSDEEISNYLMDLKIKEGVEEELLSRQTQIKTEEISIDDLNLSFRTHNCLRFAHIKTLGDLLEYNAPRLLRINNFGRKSLAEIDELLSRYHLNLRQD